MIKLYIVEVLVQHAILNLNRPFSYLVNEHIEVGVRVLISFNNQKIVGYVLSVTLTEKSQEQLNIDMGYDFKFIDEIIDTKPILNNELVELSDQVSSYYYASKISVLHAMLPPSLRPAKGSLKAAKIAYEWFVEAVRDDTQLASLTKKQKVVYDSVINVGLTKKSELSSSVTKKLLELGLFRLVKKQKNRLKLPAYADVQAPKLTLEQTNAVNAIYYGDRQTSLLEGVTGSGKTEVYLKLAELYLQAGKNVLILVPEIALTPMMVKYFLTRFDTKVALFHSELTPSEKYDEYRRIASGEVRVVVGARSAIFVPLSNLGLIVIDEEHSATYKQETPPYYHALSVAEMRAKTYNAKVVVGSATPSLETRSRALKGIYGYVQLQQRINKQPLPNTQIVDMLNYKNVSKQSAYLSNVLVNSLEETLQKKEQAILLVNRRGYASYISCRHCGFVARCPECGLGLTYHRGEDKLKCHHCGHEEAMIKMCPDCQSTYLRSSGFGTERAVEAVAKLFPSARILRLDSDVAKSRSNTTRVLGDFARHEADILIGTQMIAKGHDFPMVTLVGVINADAGLVVPSYRASENTFQLIMQAVGRSGRAHLSGRAIIQTTLPTHYAVVDASRQDYDRFYQAEMKYRHLAKMPPFTYLIQINLSCHDEDKLEDTIITLKSTILQELGSDVSVIGPSIPLFQVIKNMHERNLIIKHTNYFRIKPKLISVLKPFVENSLFRVKINVDPFDI
ncbi:MAG: primosomal protein N' [Bacilli bacterium]